MKHVVTIPKNKTVNSNPIKFEQLIINEKTYLGLGWVFKTIMKYHHNLG